MSTNEPAANPSDDDSDARFVADLERAERESFERSMRKAMDPLGSMESGGFMVREGASISVEDVEDAKWRLIDALLDNRPL